MTMIHELNEPSRDEALARNVAHIIGDQSAAALALRDLDKRRATGQGAWITNVGKSWFVGFATPPKD